MPHLDIFISFPLIRMQMMLFSEEMDYLRFCYVGIQWQIYKWEGKIKIYQDSIRFRSDAMMDDDAQVIDKQGCWISERYKLRHYCPEHWEEQNGRV